MGGHPFLEHFFGALFSLKSAIPYGSGELRVPFHHAGADPEARHFAPRQPAGIQVGGPGEVLFTTTRTLQ